MSLTELGTTTQSVYTPSRDKLNLLEEDERWNDILAQNWDMLIHCAWITAHGDFWSSAENGLWRDASIRFFRRFFEKPNRKIVSLGTCAEYDWNDCSGPLTEDSHCKPATLYGQAKYETYLALKELAQATHNDYLWPRIFFTFGPGESENKLIPAMIRSEATASPMQCGPANTERDFSSFRSIGQAIAQLAQSSCKGAVNIGTGSAISLSEIHTLIPKPGGSSGSVTFKPNDAGKKSSIVADVTKAHKHGASIKKSTTLEEMKRYISQLSD